MKKSLIIIALILTLFAGCNTKEVKKEPVGEKAQQENQTTIKDEKGEKDENLTNPKRKPIDFTRWEIPKNNDPATLELLDTSKWETYSNNDYRFSIKYPKNWEIKFEAITHFLFTTNKSNVKDQTALQFEIEDKNTLFEEYYISCNITIFKSFENIPLKEWIDKSGLYSTGEGVSNNQKEELTTINNFGGMKILESGTQSLAKSFYFQNDIKKLIYRFGFLIDGDWGTEEERKPFDQYRSVCETMVNTFNLF